MVRARKHHPTVRLQNMSALELGSSKSVTMCCFLCSLLGTSLLHSLTELESTCGFVRNIAAEVTTSGMG